MNIYVSHNYLNIDSAGSKAKSDVEKIMASEAFKNVGLARSTYQSKPMHFFVNLIGILKAATKIRRGDVLYLQYPLKKYFTFICKVAHMRRAKVVALIHDLGSCRRKAMTLDKELRRLSHADCVIASNMAMKRYLENAGFKRPMCTLDAWDYLTKSDPIPSRVHDSDVRIAYAGSLNRRKNSFLWHWGDVIKSYKVDIYGAGFRMDEVSHPEHFFDHGFVSPDRLIAGMTCDFGLVWDGDSLEGCSGDFGEYLALNTPHKVSLYLRSKVPVIIWSGAAMAPFITENNIGFTVDNLAQIEEKLAALTPEDIAEMRYNVLEMSQKIASGHFFRSAYRHALQQV